ncbi:hypothetical protein ANCCAN_10632 [Ancylostoma caninum]|uniref:Uncharacterized protein n=1 Tax=Ancylostoma caninum TaxID=29170 RepID=A0A368GI51_ANCCA|nr:hypothetical protein ANCCAN_10632 [Ancylostoma caninum]
MSGSSGKIVVNKFAARRPKKKFSPCPARNNYDYITLVSSDGIKFYVRRVSFSANIASDILSSRIFKLE